MKNIFLLVLSIISVASSKAQEWKKFTDTVALFSASYPSTWANKTNDDGRVFFTSPPDKTDDPFRENINIKVSHYKDVSGNFNLNEVIDKTIVSLKEGSFKDFNLISWTNFRWSKQDAAEIVYTAYIADMGNEKMKFTQWFCFFNNRFYVLTYCAVDNEKSHDLVARRIMKSIVFL